MKNTLLWFKIRLFLLYAAAHEHAALYLQLLWSVVERILTSLPF
jgi:hypothetical protein